MQAALGDAPGRRLPGSTEGVQFARIDPATGLLAAEPGGTGVLLPFVAGTAPPQTSPEPRRPPQNFFLDDRDSGSSRLVT